MTSPPPKKKKYAKFLNGKINQHKDVDSLIKAIHLQIKIGFANEMHDRPGFLKTDRKSGKTCRSERVTGELLTSRRKTYSKSDSDSAVTARDTG